VGLGSWGVKVKLVPKLAKVEVKKAGDGEDSRDLKKCWTIKV